MSNEIQHETGSTKGLNLTAGILGIISFGISIWILTSISIITADGAVNLVGNALFAVFATGILGLVTFILGIMQIVKNKNSNTPGLTLTAGILNVIPFLGSIAAILSLIAGIMD